MCRQAYHSSNALRRGCTISVLQSMRGVSHVEFLKTIKTMQEDVYKWSKTQSPKARKFGVYKLYNCLEEAFGAAFIANCRYPKDEEDYIYREKYFLQARDNLHAFNAQIPIVNNILNISNKRLKRWCNSSEKAINLINGVLKSDKRKVTKIKADKAEAEKSKVDELEAEK